MRTRLLLFLWLWVVVALLLAGTGWTLPIEGEPGVGASQGVGPTREVTPEPTDTQRTPVYGYRVLAAYPHDRGAFTQGLVYHQGALYESTGLWGASSLRKVALETGNLLQMRSLPDRYFGEGLTLFRDRLYQLTWKSQTGFIYDRATFQLLGTFRYPTEGWGLTHNGREFIMSDGTPTLFFLDPRRLRPLRTVEVHDERGPVWRLNELEYIDGQVYANVWQTDRIARIDPVTGRVTAWIDLTGLLPPEDRAGADVLNGIAWDAEGRRLFVTGKRWPTLFHIELVPPEGVEATSASPSATPGKSPPEEGCRWGAEGP
jgi:glutamine cyclotransferase